MASQAVLEEAGNQQYQNHHMTELFDKGLSFSGFERDGLFRNGGDGTFVDVSGVSGLDSISDGRGCSFADLDNDGDLDVVMTPVQGQARLVFRNNIGQDNAFVRVSVQGTTSARDAFGTVVRLRHGRRDWIQTKIKSGGSGFVSSSDPRLLFGLGADVDSSERFELEVQWPSGLIETIEDVGPGMSLHVIEGEARRVVAETRSRLPDPESKDDRLARSLRMSRNEPLPAISVVDVDNGRTIPLASLIGNGRKTLVNVWATWCVPCAVEMPELAKLHAALKRNGIDVLGISLDFEALRRVRSYLSVRSIPYPNVLLSEADIPVLFSTAQVAVPMSLLLDEQGRLMEVISGWSAQTKSRLEALASDEAAGGQRDPRK